jgi:ubiquinone/menaquinone biosynthesis C-methylase UbiE
MKRKDEVWKSEERARRFLDEIRPALPWTYEQIESMVRLIEARGEPVNNFANLGCGGGMLAATILERYPQPFGTLLDFSETMFKEAEHKLADRSADLRFLRARIKFNQTFLPTGAS